MKTIDVRGMQCPLPIIETRKALKELAEGELLKVLIDNSTSVSNLSKFLDDNNCRYNSIRQENHWEITVVPGNADIPESPADMYCSTGLPMAPRGRFVVVLSSDTMGSGDDILGRKLMESFVSILTELDSLPSAVVCYNGGVKLALPGTHASDTLAELERRGVEVVLCGTCIDFFGIKDKIVAGKTGDMYRIATLVSSAASVIKP